MTRTLVGPVFGTGDHITDLEHCMFVITPEAIAFIDGVRAGWEAATKATRVRLHYLEAEYWESEFDGGNLSSKGFLVDDDWRPMTGDEELTVSDEQFTPILRVDERGFNWRLLLKYGDESPSTSLITWDEWDKLKHQPKE